jgi:hypothetical protein
MEEKKEKRKIKEKWKVKRIIRKCTMRKNGTDVERKSFFLTSWV